MGFSKFSLRAISKCRTVFVIKDCTSCLDIDFDEIFQCFSTVNRVFTQVNSEVIRRKLIKSKFGNKLLMSH